MIWRSAVLGALCGLVVAGAGAAQAQGGGAVASASIADIEEILVTGSRIRRSPLDAPAPVLELSEEDLDRGGLTNLGAILQRLPSAGSAINSRFNVPGNFGFPQDGGGIGAGAAQVALRNLGAKRTLVLVDGRRWIAGASASGVPIAVDLNSLPANAIERVEILHEGASAIYGSDAIGGVVNLITRQDFTGLRAAAQTGRYLPQGDGQASEYSLLWGGGGPSGRFLASASYAEEGAVYSSDRAQSAFPFPFATSCEAGGCSSFTPQGRFILGPNFGYADLALNDGARNDGGAHRLRFDPGNPASGDFHAFASADRFNFNANRYNFLMTPNRRLNLYGQIAQDLSDALQFTAKAAYANRKSSTGGAPEPLCLGNGCGNAILRNVAIDADQIYNPFGADLSVANGGLEFFGRRPLESGPRMFEQKVDTYFLSAGLDGRLALGERSWDWNLRAAYGHNQGRQRKLGAHNAAKLAIALGDPEVCAATPGCVPFNFFGGQGPNGEGSITPAMLDFVGFVQRDFSDQSLQDYAASLTGEALDLPAGPLAFAAGIEHRRHEGRFQPDPIAERGETAGIPAGATQGRFSVTELHGELNAPLLAAAPGIGDLELGLALRRSDYGSVGAKTTFKASGLWRPRQDLSVRGSFSTGIRAPGIGELFGGAVREDFLFLDPCADVHGVIGAANGGRDAPQPQSIVAGCAALGLPPDLAQTNPQLSAASSGNEALRPETSSSLMLGFIHRPGWTERLGWLEALTLSVDYHQVKVDDAIQGRNPADILTACAQTLDSRFCDAVQRSGRGTVEWVDNQLRNIGGIETSGTDIALEMLGPPARLGQLGLQIQATRLHDFLELSDNPGGDPTRTDLAGTITNEAFQRAFPKWRCAAKLDWRRAPWEAGLTLRHLSGMEQPSGNRLDARLYADLRIQYRIERPAGALTATLGFNNILDRDPAVCDACGPANMSPVAHDLPGVSGYFGLALER